VNKKKDKGLTKRNKSKNYKIFDQKIKKRIEKENKPKNVKIKIKVLIISEDSGSFLTYFYDLGGEVKEKISIRIESYKGGTLLFGLKKLEKILKKEVKYDKIFYVYDYDRVLKYLEEAKEFERKLEEIRDSYKQVVIEEIRSHPFAEIHILQFFIGGNLSEYNSIEKICIKLNSSKKSKFFGKEKLDEKNIKSSKIRIYNSETKKPEIMKNMIKNSKNRNIEKDFGSEIYKIVEYLLF